MITKEQFGFNAFWWEQLHTEAQIAACLDYIASLGFKYVELKRSSFPLADLEKEFATAVRLARKAGLTVSNIVILGSLTGGDARHIDDVVETVRAAAHAGVNVINTISGWPAESVAAAPDDWWMPPQTSHGPAWDNLVRALERIAKTLDESDAYLALEPLTGALVHDFYSIEAMYRRIDHPRLGITLDPSHLLLYRNDIPYAIRQLGGKIKHVHMKDAVGRPGVFGLDYLFPTLGAGAIDWKAFFQALDAINYQGAISGEYEQFKYMAHVKGNDPQFAARTTYEEMTALYALYEGSSTRRGV